MYKRKLGLLGILCLVLLSACAHPLPETSGISLPPVHPPAAENPTEIFPTDTAHSLQQSLESEAKETSTENKTLTLYIGEEKIPVIWEDNDSVAAIREDALKEEIIVPLSMYSDNEQVGSLGKVYPANNQQTLTHNGDIVLYNSNNIVLFYGSNSWSYTRLGRMLLSEQEVTKLLSNGNVTIRLKASDD